MLTTKGNPMTTAANGRFIFSDLCRELRTPPSRVRYHLNQRGIRPVETMAHIHIYDTAALDALRESIAKTAAAKVGAGE